MIAAIPTKYHDVQFRSRLEAHWAAFFDLVGWRWEYEPLDLPGWIPDFRLVAKQPLLVEVKPTLTPSAGVGEKMQHALAQGCINRPDLADAELVLLGERPRRTQEDGDERPALGWFVVDGGFSSAAFSRTETGGIDFFDTFYSYHHRISGQGHGGHWLPAVPWTEVEKLWREAGNLVQWKKP